RATKLRAESARATQESDKAMRYAQNLHDQVSGRPAAPGLGQLLDLVGHGDPKLDDAVAAAKAQDAAMKAAAAAEQPSEAADRAVPTARAASTEATALVARIDVRIQALKQGEESLD